MDVFVRCNECELLKAPSEGDYIVIRQHAPKIVEGQVVEIFEHHLKVIWACRKCSGISFTETAMPSPN